MTKRHIITYVLLALACIPAYLFGRTIMIEQEPTGYVVASNFTLNYLLLFVLAGAISPWLASKIPLRLESKYIRIPLLYALFRWQFRMPTMSILVMLALVCALLIVLTLAGMKMRWS